MDDHVEPRLQLEMDTQAASVFPHSQEVPEMHRTPAPLIYASDQFANIIQPQIQSAISNERTTHRSDCHLVISNNEADLGGSNEDSLLLHQDQAKGKDPILPKLKDFLVEEKEKKPLFNSTRRLMLHSQCIQTSCAGLITGTVYLSHDYLAKVSKRMEKVERQNKEVNQS